ncbi:hypothetical protein MRX96_006869 [Rhipicephalus microplus]
MTGADESGVNDEAGAHDAAETSGQQRSSHGECTPSSRDSPVVPFGPETFEAWFTDFALRRTLPPVLPNMDVPTFAGQATDSADRPVAWSSRLLRDPPLEAPESFRGLLLSDRHPTVPPQHYAAEESRILYPICRVPEISRRTHEDGSLHRSRLLAVAIRDAIDRPPRHPAKTVEAAVTLLRSARSDLLTQGALFVPVDDLLDF